MRSLVPAVVMIMDYVCFKKTYSPRCALPPINRPPAPPPYRPAPPCHGLPASVGAELWWCIVCVWWCSKRRAVVPIIVGVALACYGEMEFRLVGFLVTSACVVLAAVKVRAGH
jgi:hypothetical protein